MRSHKLSTGDHARVPVRCHRLISVSFRWLRELMVPSVHFMTSRILHIFKRIGTIIADSMKADAKFTGFHQFVDEVNGPSF